MTKKTEIGKPATGGRPTWAGVGCKQVMRDGTTCGNQVECKGFCPAHYRADLRRRRREGDPSLKPAPPCQEIEHGEVCGRPVFSNGRCSMHDQRFRRHRATDRKTPYRFSICSVEGCGREARAHSLCAKHLARKNRWGDTSRSEKKVKGAPRGKCAAVSGLERCDRESYCFAEEIGGLVCKKHYAGIWRKRQKGGGEDGPAPARPAKRSKPKAICPVVDQLGPCENPVYGGGMCRNHHARLARTGTTDYIRVPRGRSLKPRI